MKAHTQKGVCLFMFKKIWKKIWNKKEWTLYLYYNGILVKRKKIAGISDITVMSINIWGHRELFHKFKINAVVKPVRLLYTDEKKKKTYWGVIFEKGIDM